MIHFIESLPTLNRSNGWTTSIFQIMLITVASSGLREQQLPTFHVPQFFFFIWYMKRPLTKLATKISMTLNFKKFNLNMQFISQNIIKRITQAVRVIRTNYSSVWLVQLCMPFKVCVIFNRSVVCFTCVTYLYLWHSSIALNEIFITKKKAQNFECTWKICNCESNCISYSLLRINKPIVNCSLWRYWIVKIISTQFIQTQSSHYKWNSYNNNNNNNNNNNKSWTPNF